MSFVLRDAVGGLRATTNARGYGSLRSQGRPAERFVRVQNQFSNSLTASFRGDAKHRTRNLEIPGLVRSLSAGGAKAPTRWDHPGMTGDTASHSRRVFCARFAWKRPALPKKGAGNAGRPMRPQPGGQKKTATPAVVTTVTPEIPGIPRTMVLTGYFVLSPVIGLSCHRRLRGITPAKLDASVEASGPHDFAVRFSAVRQ